MPFNYEHMDAHFLYFDAMRTLDGMLRQQQRKKKYSNIFCLERFPLPLGAWDGLCYFIVALPEPSVNYLLFQIQQ